MTPLEKVRAVIGIAIGLVSPLSVSATSVPATITATPFGALADGTPVELYHRKRSMNHVLVMDGNLCGAGRGGGTRMLMTNVYSYVSDR